jgi:hypothetical protein
MGKFNQWIDEHGGNRFEWGKWDCSLAVAHWLKTANGCTAYDDISGTYSTPLGAYRLINSMGGLDAICDKYIARKQTTFAQTGDVHLLRDGRRVALGIDAGKQVFCSTTTGFKFVNKKRVKIEGTWGVNICHK